MEIYFAFQAALCFSIAHIFIRRGLVESNAMTGSFISLTMTALLLCSLLAFFVPPAALWTPAIAIFVAAGIFAPGIGRTLSYVGIEKIGVARSVPIVNSSPIFAFIFAVIFSRRSVGFAKYHGNSAGDYRCGDTVDRSTCDG